MSPADAHTRWSPAPTGSPWYKQLVVSPSVPDAYLLGYDDWLSLPDDNRLQELIDGELFVSPSPNIAHQRAARDLGFLLFDYMRRTGQGELLMAPTGVRLDERTVLQPDLLVVLRRHAESVGGQVVEGPPDLVVEVLSPGTARRDLGIKREKYRSSGVPEYWIVDPANAFVEVLVLQNEEYLRFGLFTRNDTLRSRVLADLEVSLADVFDP
jgi:Uma2 family endonuclease